MHYLTDAYNVVFEIRRVIKNVTYLTFYTLHKYQIQIFLMVKLFEEIYLKRIEHSHMVGMSVSSKACLTICQPLKKNDI